MFTSNFGSENKILLGANSVHRGSTGAGIVIKNYTDSTRNQWMAEIKYLVAFRNHANIVQLLGYGETNRRLFLIYPLMGRGSVQQNLHGLTWKQMLQILKGTAAAITALHSHSPPLIHRDVKPANILLDQEGNAILCDFGTVGPSDQAIAGGTPGYTERATLDGQAQTGSDIYSLGVVILQLIMKRERVIRPSIQSNNFRDLHIIGWVTEALPRAGHVVDISLLLTGCNTRQARAISQLGLACSNQDILSRPTIEAVTERLLEIEATKSSRWSNLWRCLPSANSQP
ncbi:hypothetical protein ACH5RR_022365 [Cinchona calisaya]|uniref:Protein kinase domain-containing protein n=1 Tax=Cinchona calisaya TaxID=153742 RepID=A0ABD2ZCJ7_9GENT